MSILPQINAAIARASYMVHGRIGLDWRSGRRFVLADKGHEYQELCAAVDALRLARDEIERLES